jgi:glycosyltransferase involved in cell wall biosynthesis
MAERAESPAVTAAIVVLNGERFIGEAIASIQAQSFEDWELLVVDDGSTDATVPAVEEALRKSPRPATLLRHADGGNHGIAASRNLALAHARGRYVAFLDADDVWEPDKLREQVAILEADPGLGLVYGRTQIWHSWDGGSGEADYYYPLGVEPDRRHEPPLLFDLLMRNKAQTPTTCNAIIRRSMFDRLGGFEDSFRDMFEDLTFFAKLLAVAPAFVSGRSWARYRQHEASCSAMSAAQGADLRKRWLFLRWLARSLPREARTPQVLRSVRRETLRAGIAIGASAMRARIKRWLKGRRR